MSNRFAFALFIIGVYHWLLGVVRPSGRTWLLTKASPVFINDQYACSCCSGTPYCPKLVTAIAATITIPITPLVKLFIMSLPHKMRALFNATAALLDALYEGEFSGLSSRFARGRTWPGLSIAVQRLHVGTVLFCPLTACERTPRVGEYDSCRDVRCVKLL
jgi:hypothetical protein